MPRVLMVAYYFPPAGGAGVQRPLKFARYLPDFGWQPVILTPRGADYPARDETLLAELPADLPIIRTPIVEPYALYRRLTGRPAGAAVDLAVLSLGEHERRRPAERLAEWLRAACFVPDARLGWLPFAVAAGYRAIRHRQISAIYTTAPPYTCHLIGWWLKRLTGRPWVCDWRDSWIGWLSAPQYRPPLARLIERAMERAVVRDADWHIVAAPAIRADLVRRTADAAARRWTVITNGFDPADVPAAVGREDRLTIVHTGTLYGLRRPTALLRGLDILRQAAPMAFADLRLRFVGRVAAAIADELTGPAYRDVVELIPYVPHAVSLGHLQSADLALLVVDANPRAPEITTGKIYEYLGARRPILALAPPDGLAGRLIRGLDAGWVVAPDDAAGVAEVLARCHAAWRTGDLCRWAADPARLTPFQRRVLAGRLADVLDRISGDLGGRSEANVPQFQP